MNESVLETLARAMARPAPGTVHLIMGPAAHSWAAALQPALN
jgi:hypothetical protein